MTLSPKLPPGRVNRKALQFAGDIRRLRSAGYTFSAIRLALLDAGIRVSLTTVKREAARRGACGVAAPSLTEAPPVRPARACDSSASTDARTGKEVAEAFFAAHLSNPLLRARKDRP